MTNDDKDFKPCPCGKQPTKLHIVGSDAKWKWVSGDCCNEWNVEFRTGYYKDESPELMERAIYAWNYAPRPTPQQPSEKKALSLDDIENILYKQFDVDIYEKCMIDEAQKMEPKSATEAMSIRNNIHKLRIKLQFVAQAIHSALPSQREVRYLNKINHKASCQCFYDKEMPCSCGADERNQSIDKMKKLNGG